MKGQLTAMLIRNEAKNEAKSHQELIPPPRTGKWAIQKPRPKPRVNIGQLVNKFEDIVIQPPKEFQDGIIEPPIQFRDKPKTEPCKGVKQMVNDYEDIIVPPSKEFRTRPKKPTRPPRLAPFDFGAKISQTGNKSPGKFEIISTQNTKNEKFKSFTNEFRMKVTKKLENTSEVYSILQDLIRTTKRRRKLSDNDRLRFVIQNKELPNAISTKFNRVKDFALSDLENVIRILEYRDIRLENCRIVVQSILKDTYGKGRLYLTKDTVSRENCVITVKNDDTICLARSIVTAYANLKRERWSKTITRWF